MPVEVGVGYVSIVPETRGFGRALQEGTRGQSEPVGQDSGEEAGKGFLSGIGGVLKGGALAVAAGAAGLFAAGFADAVEKNNASGLLAARLGLSDKESARAGKIAGGVYAKGYGESIDEVNDAIKALQQNSVASINGPRKAIAGLTQDALALSEAFGVDVNESASAVGQMIRTGLVKNGKEGFDLLTAGFQSGADKAGDLIDTVNEYGTQWRKAGISAAGGIGLINQGLQAGARDGDIVADAIKEFSIRAIDGSDTTAAGFKALGLDADHMASKFAKGGKTANGVLQLTLDRLRGIKDPVKQSQAAVALFGSQAEDLGGALLALDPSKATAAMGKVGGAASDMASTLHDPVMTSFEVFKRRTLAVVSDLITRYVLPGLGLFGQALNDDVFPAVRLVGGVVDSTLVPAVKGAVGAFAAGVQWLRTWGVWLSPLAVLVGGLTLALTASAIASGISTAATWAGVTALTVAETVTAGFTAAQAALNTVMALNPIALVVIGLLALGTALFVAYKKSETFRGIVQATWAGIKVGWDALWGALQVGFAGFLTGLRAVGAAASWLWTSVLSPTFSAIATGAKVLVAVIAVLVVTPLVLAFRLVGAVGGWLWTTALQPAFQGIAAGAMWLWNSALSPAFRGIAAGAMWLWNSALSPAFRGIAAAAVWLYTAGIKPTMTGIVTVLRVAGAAGVWLYRSALLPAWHGIVAAAVWTWSGVRAVFGLLTAGMHAVGAAGTWLYRSAISPALHGIGSAASTLWTRGLKPAFDSIKSGVHLVGDAFDSAQRAIGKAFGKIESITKKPVNFVLNQVYSHGIKAVWDKVAGFVGLGKLPAAPKLLKEGGRTRGGIPGKDSIPALMMADEFVVKRDSARRVGFGTLEYINRTGELPAGPVQKFADGGVVGEVAGWIGDKAKAIGSAVMDGADFLAHPGRLWDKATGFVRGKIAAIGQNRFAQMIGKVPLKMLSSLKDKVVKAATGMFGGSSGDIGGSGVKRWSSVVLQALKMVGQPASLLPTVLRRMNQESGGNPHAINNWDVNAKNGVPSKGLMQVIGPTFAAYAGKLAGRGIWDPLANIYASMRYAMSRYGSLASAYNRPGGYAKGGRPKRGEVAWVGEQGPELIRFGGGDTEVFDHRTSLGMAAGLVLRGFAKGTSGTKAAAAARRQVGTDLGQFTKSLTGSASDIAKAARSLADDLRKTGRAGRALADQVGRTSGRLQSLAKQRDAVAGKLATARQAAADQKSSAADYMSLSNLGDVTSVGGLISGMQGRQQSLAGFQSLIKTAQKKGVSQSVIQQLVAAGPDSNLAQLVAGASAGDVKKINALAKSGAKLSTSYGNAMADAMYDAGSQAGKGFLTGLKAQEAELQKQMKKLGDVLVDSIEDRLKIHSPSRETERVGAMVGAGVVVGSDKALAAVRAGAERLGTAAIPPVVPAAAVAAQTQAAGLQRGDTVVLRVGEREIVAVLDERVDAGLADVRTRSRAGSKRR
ncbi:phage tail tape measure protein [Streptomyces sp. NPDC014991]|uniref:phage tail tape measure protein n=1 Tax=Streptomyces sp. NPDC014991 TaxID=3364935 RepID=UPI0036F86F9C